MRHLTALIITLLVASACAQSSAPLEAPHPGAPCGNAGVVCFGVMPNGVIAPTGMCCFEGSVCGGGGYINVGCPAGECCYEGTDAVGALPPRPQFPAGRFGIGP